jgi:hypothetical protein
MKTGIMNFTNNLGMLVLAICLILVGISTLVAFAIPRILLGIIALIAGVSILGGWLRFKARQLSLSVNWRRCSNCYSRL